MSEPTFSTPGGYILHDLRRVKDVWPGGISYAEIAKRTGMPKAHLVRLMRGEGNPTVETLCRIAAALDRTLHFELLDNNSDPEEELRLVIDADELEQHRHVPEVRERLERVEARRSKAGDNNDASTAPLLKPDPEEER